MNNDPENIKSKYLTESKCYSPITQENQFYIQTLNCYKSLILYFSFSELIKTNLADPKNIYEYSVHLIDSYWFNNFQNKCNYNLIEYKIKNQKNKDYKLLLNEFSKKNLLSSNIFDISPKHSKKFKNDKIECYSENYEIINEEIMNCFKIIFKNISLFKIYKIIVKKAIIILPYDNHNLEIINYIEKNKKEKFLFVIYDSLIFKKIQNIFRNNNFDEALNKLNIKDKYLSNQKIIVQNIEIGIMKNLSDNNTAKFFYSQQNFYENKNNDNKGFNINKKSNIIELKDIKKNKIEGIPFTNYAIEYGTTKGYIRPKIKKGKDFYHFYHYPELIKDNKRVSQTLKSLCGGDINESINLNNISLNENLKLFPYAIISSIIKGCPFIKYGNTKGYVRPKIKKGKDFYHNPVIVNFEYRKDKKNKISIQTLSSIFGEDIKGNFNLNSKPLKLNNYKIKNQFTGYIKGYNIVNNDDYKFFNNISLISGKLKAFILLSIYYNKTIEKTNNSKKKKLEEVFFVNLKWLNCYGYNKVNEIIKNNINNEFVIGNNYEDNEFLYKFILSLSQKEIKNLENALEENNLRVENFYQNPTFLTTSNNKKIWFFNEFIVMNKKIHDLFLEIFNIKNLYSSFKFYSGNKINIVEINNSKLHLILLGSILNNENIFKLKYIFAYNNYNCFDEKINQIYEDYKKYIYKNLIFNQKDINNNEYISPIFNENGDSIIGYCYKYNDSLLNNILNEDYNIKNELLNIIQLYH